MRVFQINLITFVFVFSIAIFEASGRGIVQRNKFY